MAKLAPYCATHSTETKCSSMGMRCCQDGPADAVLQGCLSWTTGQVPVRCRPLQLILSLNELRTYLSIMQPKMRLQVASPLSCKASACDVVASRFVTDTAACCCRRPSSHIHCCAPPLSNCIEGMATCLTRTTGLCGAFSRTLNPQNIIGHG